VQGPHQRVVIAIAIALIMFGAWKVIALLARVVAVPRGRPITLRSMPYALSTSHALALDRSRHPPGLVQVSRRAAQATDALRDLEVANSPHTEEDGSAAIQIRISGSSPAARNRDLSGKQYGRPARTSLNLRRHCTNGGTGRLIRFGRVGLLRHRSSGTNQAAAFALNEQLILRTMVRLPRVKVGGDGQERWSCSAPAFGAIGQRPLRCDARESLN
jgi:hypothetical protein